MSVRALLALLFAAVSIAGCSAVYPELQAPIRSAKGRDMDAPPTGLHWIAFKSAKVPEQTRDGRRWGGDLGRPAPDPYAILFLNGKPLFKTPVQGNTLEPTWPDGPAGNFRLRPTDRFRVEVWDSNPINDHPIGIKEIGELNDETERTGEADVECDTGAKVRIAFEPARARLGLGFYYELRIGQAFVTRVYEESPAGRSGIKPGDQILMLDNKSVADMKSGEVQSIINTPHMDGLPIKIRHADGKEVNLTLKEGAIFPLFSEMGTFR
jgi:hypothetical protein